MCAQASNLCKNSQLSNNSYSAEEKYTSSSQGQIAEGFPQQIPEDIMFPNELNCYLRQQIQYYVHESTMLKNNLSHLETEYDKFKLKNSQLEEKLNNYENALNKTSHTTSTYVAASKIVELSKRIREQNSEIESLKTKCSKLEKTLLEVKCTHEDPMIVQTPSVQPLLTANESDMKKLQDKLNQTSNKLIETRNLNMRLKNDLKLANKFLQQEIGQTFESIQMCNISGNWRGRAQIITDLQQKNIELKERFKNLLDKSRHCNEEIASISTDSKHSLLSKENDDLKCKFDEIKKKLEGTKARCRALDVDYGILKSKFANIKEQSDKDQKLIATLTLQLAAKDIKPVKSKKEKLAKKLQVEKNQLIKEVNEYKNVVKDMKQEIANRDNIIDEFKNGQPIICNDNQSKTSTELQILADYIEQQNTRLSTEREAHMKTQALLRTEKQRAAKAEAVVSKFELDSYRSGSYSNSMSSKTGSTLLDQLELAQENVKALQTRLEIEQFERMSDVQEFTKIIQCFEEKNKNI